MSTARQGSDTHEHDEMLTIDEAATYLRVPVATMRYWRYCGTGPFSFKIQRHVRYWRTDLVLWRAEQGRATGRSPQANARSAPGRENG